jgi:hypothetical protein
LRVLISEYYINLFGEPEQNYFSSVEDNNEDILQLSIDESNILTADFDIDEVKEAIMQKLIHFTHST